jgi:hypothetical protein
MGVALHPLKGSPHFPHMFGFGGIRLNKPLDLNSPEEEATNKPPTTLWQRYWTIFNSFVCLF